MSYVGNLSHLFENNRVLAGRLRRQDPDFFLKLKIRHIIVCGHYGCSGVQAVLRRERLGLSDNWLRHVQENANS
jgi:hypothetical protein